MSEDALRYMTKVHFAIVTALEIEYVAMKALLVNPTDHFLFYGDEPFRVCKGIIPDGSKNKEVILVISGIGNNKSAITISRLAGLVTSLRYVLMVGIAGGVPNKEDPTQAVRLGDIVVADEHGVVQYDLIKLESDSVIVHRHTCHRPSAQLLSTGFL